MRLYLLLVQDIMDQNFSQLNRGKLATEASPLFRTLGLRIISVVDDNKGLVGMVSRSMMNL